MSLDKCKVSFRISKITYVKSVSVPKTPEPQQASHWVMLVAENEPLEVTTARYSGTLDKEEMLLIEPNTEYSFFSSSHRPVALTVGFECSNAKLRMFTKSGTYLPLSIHQHLSRAVKEASFLFPENGTATVRSNNIPFGSEQILWHELEYVFVMLIRKALMEIDYASAPKHPANQKDRLITQVLEYVDSHIHENLSNFSLCTQFGTNKTTLCKLFRQATGFTLINYINQSKIQLAKTMIREGKMNFTEIAEALSFSSVHYFCKTFIRYEHMTPTEYSKTVTLWIDGKK